MTIGGVFEDGDDKGEESDCDEVVRKQEDDESDEDEDIDNDEDIVVFGVGKGKLISRSR